MEFLQPYPPESDPGPRPPDAAKVILLVDDDMELRTSLRDFLVNLGFQVLEARDAYDGLFLCAQYGTRIDILLTEINLLPVGGIKLAENALRLWPQIQVVCMSQAFDAPGTKYWMRYLGAHFLRKPFTPLELHECLQMVSGQIQDGMPLPLPENGVSPTSSQFWERRYPPESPQAIGFERSDSQDPTFWMKEF
jgi:DNA-binding response OmpR family regulator